MIHRVTIAYLFTAIGAGVVVKFKHLSPLLFGKSLLNSIHPCSSALSVAVYKFAVFMITSRTHLADVLERRIAYAATNARASITHAWHKIAAVIHAFVARTTHLVNKTLVGRFISAANYTRPVVGRYAGFLQTARTPSLLSVAVVAHMFLVISVRFLPSANHARTDKLLYRHNWLHSLYVRSIIAPKENLVNIFSGGGN